MFGGECCIGGNYDKFLGRIDNFVGKRNAMGIIEQLAEIKYEEGREQQRAADARLFVERLLNNTEFDSNKIASLADVTEEFVEQVRRELGLR